MRQKNTHFLCIYFVNPVGVILPTINYLRSLLRYFFEKRKEKDRKRLAAMHEVQDANEMQYGWRSYPGYTIDNQEILVPVGVYLDLCAHKREELAKRRLAQKRRKQLESILELIRLKREYERAFQW